MGNKDGQPSVLSPSHALGSWRILWKKLFPFDEDAMREILDGTIHKQQQSRLTNIDWDVLENSYQESIAKLEILKGSILQDNLRRVPDPGLFRVLDILLLRQLQIQSRINFACLSFSRRATKIITGVTVEFLNNFRTIKYYRTESSLESIMKILQRF